MNLIGDDLEVVGVVEVEALERGLVQEPPALAGSCRPVELLGVGEEFEGCFEVFSDRCALRTDRTRSKRSRSMR
jgi:hypothetical protein